MAGRHLSCVSERRLFLGRSSSDGPTLCLSLSFSLSVMVSLCFLDFLGFLLLLTAGDMAEVGRTEVIETDEVVKAGWLEGLGVRLRAG